MSLVKAERKGNIARIVLNRPEKKNALSPDVLSEMKNVLDSLKEISVVIISGEGGFFSAGGDLSVMFKSSEEEGVKFSKMGNDFMDYLQDFDAITIAAMEGGAYGGGLELALSCDLRVASEKTKIGLTEINLGLLPGWGGLKRLIRIAGNGTARYVALTGKVMDGNEAHSLGLVNYLTSDPVKFSDELAAELSQKSKESIRRIKALLGRAEYSSDLEEKMFGEILGTPTAKSTLEKFLKK